MKVYWFINEDLKPESAPINAPCSVHYQAIYNYFKSEEQTLSAIDFLLNNRQMYEITADEASRMWQIIHGMPIPPALIEYERRLQSLQYALYSFHDLWNKGVLNAD